MCNQHFSKKGFRFFFAHAIILDDLVGKLASDQTLGVEDGVARVTSDLIFGGITDQTLGVGEGDVRGSGTVTLIVGDDFDTCFGTKIENGFTHELKFLLEFGNKTIGKCVEIMINVFRGS